MAATSRSHGPSVAGALVARRGGLGSLGTVIAPYTELPQAAGGLARPLLDVVVGDMDELRFPCLVDSGALHTLLPRWLATSAGIDLHEAEKGSLAVAASGTEAAFVTTLLRAANHTWEAEVGFCDPWPYSWGLFGQQSFFRFFTVTFRAADLEFEVAPLAS